MVTKRTRLSFFGIVNLLWGWTVVTSIDSSTVDTATADDHVEQHMRNPPAQLNGQGRTSVEERAPPFTKVLDAKLVLRFKEYVPSTEKAAYLLLNKQHIPIAANKVERAIKILNHFGSTPTAMEQLFKLFKIGLETSSLADDVGFRKWDIIVAAVWMDPQERDKLMFQVLKKLLPSWERELTGAGQTSAELVKSADIRKRYDAVQADKWVSAEEPFLDLSSDSLCSKWLKSKVVDEREAAIVLLLSTMQSKGITNKKKALRQAARGNGFFIEAIDRHESLVTLNSKHTSAGLLLHLFPVGTSVQTILHSELLVDWIDIVKMNKYDPNELLVNLIQYYGKVSEIAAELYDLSNPHLTATLDGLGEGPRLFPITAYHALLQSWKTQGLTLINVTRMLKLNKKSKSGLMHIVVKTRSTVNSS